MRAMIMAAGYGTRLWPLTADRAKAAVPFLNRPLIAYSLDYLATFGIDDFIINLHHFPETVKAAVERSLPPHCRVHFSYEPEILGTGGALDKVRDYLTDCFVVINGKIVTDIDLSAAIQTHRQQNALATLVLLPNVHYEKFSRVHIADDGRILGFSKAPTLANPQTTSPPLLFTGIQIAEPRLLQYIPRGRFSHTTEEAYPNAIKNGETIAAHIATGHWYEFSTLQRYLDHHLEFMKLTGQSYIAGKELVAESGVTLSDSVLWDHVSVKHSASLRRCVVGDAVQIPPGMHFENVAIVRRDLCPQPPAGTIIGDNLIVPITNQS